MHFSEAAVEGVTIANDVGIWESHVEKESEAEAITALDAFFVQETTKLGT
jgi:hypothetical protein